MGRDLIISNEKVSKNDFKSSINGTFKLPIFEKDFATSDFICQDVYGNLLYNPSYFKEVAFDNRRILKLIKRGEFEFVKALAENRIKYFAFIEQWMSYFVENNVSFSFGTRIHGTIMPILSGVPSMILPCNSRTKEMAEFFDIPMLNAEKNKKYSLYDLYLETDFSKFNKTFSKRFDEYESFLKKCGLVEKINQNNIYMQREAIVEMPEIINKGELDRINNLLKKNKLIYNTANLFYK